VEQGYEKQFEVAGEIILEPNWENTALWFAHAFRFNDFEKGAKDPIISFIEQIRYLSITDPEAVERILANLKR
jgi:hypothetical protein